MTKTNSNTLEYACCIYNAYGIYDRIHTSVVSCYVCNLNCRVYNIIF